MEKKERVNKKTIKIWRHHLQDEVDATFLYSVFAELETDDDRKEILSDLSEVESKHVDRWEKMLSTYDIKFKHIKPSLKAQFWSWYARHIDKVLPLARMLKEEASEVKEYIALHKSSTHTDAKETALILAKESAQHTESLNELTGTTDEPWHKTESGGVLGNIIYGFNDGLTANFGLVAGVIAAAESVNTILVAGIVGTVADSLSMGASGYLAAKSEQEVYDHEIQVEKDEIRLMPDIEEEELALIYASRGVPKEHAQELAKEVMSDPERALEEKIQAELKIGKIHTTPFSEGWVTGLATAIGAFIPVAPFLFTEGMIAIWISFTIAMLSHFIVGSARSLFTGRGIIRSGFDMFVVGLGVAGVGYLVGMLLDYLFL